MLHRLQILFGAFFLVYFINRRSGVRKLHPISPLMSHCHFVSVTSEFWVNVIYLTDYSSMECLASTMIRLVLWVCGAILTLSNQDTPSFSDNATERVPTVRQMTVMTPDCWPYVSVNTSLVLREVEWIPVKSSCL